MLTRVLDIHYELKYQIVHSQAGSNPCPPPSGKRTVSSSKISNPSMAGAFLAAPGGFHLAQVTDTTFVSN